MSDTVFDNQGSRLRLARRLGRGGEGSVYDIAGQPDFVIKLYHQPLTSARMAKLNGMAFGSSDQLLSIAAWPVRTVHLIPGGPVAGFIMPKVSGYQEAHLLHGPRSRLRHFSDAGWPFLIHTAANTARAFTVIHQHGHVIGDVNDRNLVVSQSGTVKLIDCDSFQIKASGATFYCEVGVPKYTPPELLGKTLRDVIRTPNHDAFGLAVLVFQLLFMGRHPFGGRPILLDDLTLEDAIKEYRFAYGSNAAARGMQPPRASVPLSIVPDSMARLFERAFSAQGSHYGRPAPHEWLGELDRLKRSLQLCGRNAAHHYFSSLPTCPWCALETASNITLFAAVVVHSVSRATSATFDVDKLWAQVLAIPTPGPVPPLPKGWNLTVAPSPGVVELGRNRRRRQRVSGLAVLGILIALAVVTPPIWVSIVVIVVTMTIVIRTWRDTDETRKARSKSQDELHRAKVAWEKLEKDWNDTDGKAFDDHRSALKRKVEDYKKLKALRAQELSKLEASARERQFQAYLRARRIHSANVPGIGPSRAAMLKAHGFETAADVSGSLLQVPGFGPVLTNNLLAWRRNVEKGFRFNAANAVSKADISKLDQQIALQRSQLSRQLQEGAAGLEKLRSHIVVKREATEPLLEPALRALRQAEADLRAL